MTRRDALDLGLMALSLASLVARVVAMAMCDLEEIFVPEEVQS